MKKIITLLSAVFAGSVAIAQTPKTDTAKKPVVRKVLTADIKNTKGDTTKTNRGGHYTIKTGSAAKQDNQSILQKSGQKNK